MVTLSLSSTTFCSGKSLLLNFGYFKVEVSSFFIFALDKRLRGGSSALVEVTHKKAYLSTIARSSEGGAVFSS